MGVIGKKQEKRRNSTLGLEKCTREPDVVHGRIAHGGTARLVGERGLTMLGLGAAVGEFRHPEGQLLASQRRREPEHLGGELLRPGPGRPPGEANEAPVPLLPCLFG